MQARLYILLLASILGITAVACGGGYGAPTAPTPTTPPAVTGGAEIVVSASYPKFAPSALTVAKGKAIRLKITSKDMAHTFTIDELGINVTVGGGQTATSEIKVDKAGTFTFYCSVPGHRDAGMEGALTVTE
ncbi:MAG: cupredoxin domain-containing protein [Dehalococcoidia bacterium]